MAEIKLRCVGYYRNDPRGEIHLVGEEFVLDEEKAQYLLRDAPGCFEVVVPEPVKRKRVRRPARDKAVREAPADK